MLPYLIAGVIGYGISKLFEDNKAPKYADGGLIAPNGKPSNLTPEQYKLVRTKAFKDWFGDWENDPENASKVVDSNGEPLVVYHGTKENWWKDYFVFNPQYEGKSSNIKRRKFGSIYFTSKKKVAQTFGNILIPVFLNFKNPIVIDGDYHDIMWVDDELETTNYEDDIIIKNTYDYRVSNVKLDADMSSDIFLVSQIFNKIKLADGTNTTFDGSNPDIRFMAGGQVLNLNKIRKGQYEAKSDKIEISLTNPKVLNGMGTNKWQLIIEYSNDIIVNQWFDTMNEALKTGAILLSDFLDSNNTETRFMAGGELTNNDVLKNFVNQVEAYQSNHYGTFNRDNLVESYHKLPDSIKEKIKPISTKNLFRGADGTSYKSAISFTKNQDYAKMFGAYAFPFNIVKENKGLIDTKRLSALLSKMRIANEIGDDEGEVIVIEPIFSKDIIKNIEKFRFDNGGLIAPNGKPSNLTPEQYKLVRTKAFKDWFGDWEKDPANASKVVDENGEPKVVWHGSKSTKDFNVFEQKPRFEFIYFADNKYYSKYHFSKWDMSWSLRPFFLNIRNLLNAEEFGFDKVTFKELNSFFYGVYDLSKDIQLNPKSEYRFWEVLRFSNDIYDSLKNQDYYNGISYYENFYDNTTWNDTDDYSLSYVVMNPNQIKLADGTNTTFDGENPDIRFAGGGQLKYKNEGAYADVLKVSKDEWHLSIIEAEIEGQGYAKKIMNQIIQDAKKQNIKKITLGSSLFNKDYFEYGYGFQETGYDEFNDLFEMELKLK